jgi:hypothetical protein
VHGVKKRQAKLFDAMVVDSSEAGILFSLLSQSRLPKIVRLANKHGPNYPQARGVGKDLAPKVR